MRCTTVATTIVTALAFCSSSAFAQQKTLKEQIVGTWNLTSWEQTYSDGRKDKSFGASPTGVNTFDSNGRFSVIFINPDVPKIASKDRVKPTPEEAMAVAKGVIAYYGTYTVEEQSKTITLNMEGTTFKNQMDQPAQKRIVSVISADELKYNNPTSTSGGKIEVALRRAK